MADLINLNKARKAKAKSEQKAGAAENRVRFGRTKAETAKGKADGDRLRRALDDARRERADD